MQPSEFIDGRAMLCAAAALLCLEARAQDGTSAARLPPVTVTGNPLGASEIVQPASTLGGEALILRRGTTLGETLDHLPGVSSTYFGPNANRPVIRGQDGDRIRVLGNGGASLDASSLSFDHAVPIDPLVVERIEVLRGPAALLYGGSAVGGVVNAIDNRIPRRPITALGGAVEVRFGGAARERGAGALIEAGGGGFALHADAFTRDTDDLRVPEFDRPVEGGFERRNRIVNSASNAKGGALGASWVGAQGYLGASVDTYRNDYGVVAEEDVTIEMRRDKLALAGEWRTGAGPIRTLRGRLQRSDYRHQEFEGGGVLGTTFDNTGNEGRLEMEHKPLGALTGVFGVQGESSRFSALGDEAFVPSTRTRQAAGFVFEELDLGATRFNAGLRFEHTTVDSAGDAADAVEPRFGAAQSQTFDAGSTSLGVLHDLSAAWQLTASVAYTERAPTYYELYANGVHIATAALERGDPALDKERGRNLDVALRWKPGPHRMLKLGAYTSRFSNYIALLATGEPGFLTDEGETVPVFAFTSIPARLSGIEFEAQWRLLEGARTVDLDGKIDTQRASNRATGEALPRLAPLRATLGVATEAGGWRARAEVVHAARQTRVPGDDIATGSYSLLNLSASYRVRWSTGDAFVFARLDNVGDRLAYNATTIGTVRPLAPLPGRSLKAGVQFGW